MKRGIMTGLAVLSLFLITLLAVIKMTDDDEGPRIQIPDEPLTYNADADNQTLLSGVSAQDTQDGDVSDSLRVVNILPAEDGATASVIYMAKDKKNNVTKATRIVQYQKGTDPKPTPADVPDANADMPISDVQTDSVTQPIENEEGSTQGAAETDAAIAELSAGSPKLYLKEYAVTVEKGSEFKRLDHVKSIEDDKDAREDLYRGIQIDGEVDSDTPGTYELIYYVTDSDGNSSNQAKLIVTVQ